MSRARRFARNVGWSLVGQAGVLAVNFATVPYLVRRMGTETYGLYILLYAAAGYLTLASLGAGGAVVKFVAQFASAGDRGRVLKTFEFGALLLGGAVLAAAAALAAGAPVLAERLFSVPPRLVPTAVFVLRCAAAGAVFAGLAQLAMSAMQGLQRFDWNNAFTLALNALLPLGAAALFGFGRGLRAAAVWYVCVNAAVCAAALAAALRLAGRVPTGAHRGGFHFKDFWRYSLSLGLGPMAWIVMFQFDKVFIANALPLAQLTLYSVPAGLLQRLQTLPAVMSTVLVPMMSELEGPDAEHTVSRLYLKGVRVLLWTILPALVLLFALMPQVLTLWLGAEFGGGSVWPARLLVLAQGVFMLTYIPNSVAAGRGKPWYLSAVAWAQAAVSVLAWWRLIPLFGILGAALGALLAQLIPVSIYLRVVHGGLLRLAPGRFFDEALFAPLASAALLLALVFPLHHLAYDWPRLVALSAGGILLYYGSAWFLLDRDEKELVLGLLKWQRTGTAGGV